MKHAHAHIHTEIVKTPKMVEVIEETAVRSVVLTLTEDEAVTLLRLTRTVGGSLKSRRRHAHSVMKALMRAGVEVDLEAHASDYFTYRHTARLVFATKRRDTYRPLPQPPSVSDFCLCFKEGV